jgi:hypothetical protein
VGQRESDGEGSRPAKRKDRRAIIVGIGVLLLALGAVSAFTGPAEFYCFSLFSEGGPFHYEGFGFGSFMFANIAAQILGYYLVAAVFLPLGYGHVRIRRWARTLSLAILQVWLIVGLPVIVTAVFSVLSVKNYSPLESFGFIAFLGLLYFAVPWLGIRFYRSRRVRVTFERWDLRRSRLEQIPVPVLALGFLFVFYAIVMHIPILLNGLFPLFGVLLSGLRGTMWLTASIVILGALAWGVLCRWEWAWWGSLAYFVLLGVSSTATFLRMDYAEILARMSLPAKESEILERLPLEGCHFALFVGIPVLLTLIAVFRARSHFRVQR